MAIDMRAVIAGLAGGADALGGNLNRRKERREVERDREKAEQRAEDRAMRMLLAKPSKENTQVVPGEDENGPGIFLVDRDTGTKKRITDQAMTQLTGAPPSAPRESLLRKPGEAMPSSGPITPPPVDDDADSHGFSGDPKLPPGFPPPVKRGGSLRPLPAKPTQGEAPQLVLGANGSYVPANRRTGLGPDGQPVQAYKPPTKPELVEVETPEGKRVLKPKVEGLEVPGPTTTGAASIRKDVAANRAQIAVIDKAIAELESHPEATGVKRSLGMVPGMGQISEMINQRADSGGVGTRNALGQVSSVTIKNRSGSAVTPSEFARLGFIPNEGFTKDANMKKLRDLRAYVEEETRLLEQSGAGPVKSPTKPPTEDPEFDALINKYKKPPT